MKTPSKDCLRIFLFAALLIGCTKSEPVEQSIPEDSYPSLFAIDNLVAWCVVPFDKMERGPKERAVMLKELGFTKFAYDWRDQHLPSFPEEVIALNENGIDLLSVWWWIDGQGDSLLNPGNRQLLSYLDSLKVPCDIWMSFDDRFFENLDDSAKLEKATMAIRELHQLAGQADAKLQLYNHGEWFGNPRNQVRIIEKTGLSDIGIIYNFHHAHQQMEEFTELLPIMLPYLKVVNINGMVKDGSKILTVGAGNYEQQMLRALLDSGFKGNIGILGHIEDEDVKLVLERNLKGLEKIASEL
ncbi:MAG: sugar phosphate isomerase/epimerase family protein [Cyclobacteriaceae bacterium]